VLAQKVQVDTDGKETEIPMDDYMETGVFSKYNQKGESTFCQTKHKMQNDLNRITIRVKDRHEQAGIDPRNLLIDTQPGKMLSR
jgi:hypothetical protein